MLYISRSKHFIHSAKCIVCSPWGCILRDSGSLEAGLPTTQHKHFKHCSYTDQTKNRLILFPLHRKFYKLNTYKPRFHRSAATKVLLVNTHDKFLVRHWVSRPPRPLQPYQLFNSLVLQWRNWCGERLHCLHCFPPPLSTRQAARETKCSCT